MKKLLIIFSLLVSAQAFSQEGELPEEQIIIQKDKKILLPEISKPQEKVTLTLKPLPKVKQKYSYRDFNLSLPLLDPKLYPPVLRSEKEQAVKEGFVRIGVGNYGSTLLDAFYNSGRKKDYAFGVFGKHLASANGPVENSGFSNNELGAYARYFTPNFTLTGSLNYARSRYNFYGYDQERFKNRPKDSTRQVFNSIWFNMNLERLKKNSPLDYKIGLGVGNISDRFKASESEVAIDFNGKYMIKDSAAIVVFSDLSLAKRVDSASQNRSLWRIQPAFDFRFKGFQLNAGFQFSVDNEPDFKFSELNYSKNKAKFHFHPQIKIQQNIFDNKVLAFAGIGGGMNNVNLRSHLQQNPFLDSNVVLKYENQLFKLFAGIKGKVKNTLTYSTEISYENLDNQGFYINDGENRERFGIAYDSTTTRRFTWSTEATYDISKETKAGVRMAFLTYGVSKFIKQPWHLPNSMVTIFGRQYLSENLMLSGELYYMGGIKGLNVETVEIERLKRLKPLVDLNLKGEYFFKKNFSGYISVHNLLNNKNERFLYYPTQGLRIMVGATALF